MKRTRARGYLLMEMMIGGSMAAVILLGMLSLILSGRAENVAASRDITANQLVTEMMEQTRAGTFPPTNIAAAPFVAAGGSYTRERIVTSTGCPEVRANPGGGPSLSFPCANVTVIVTFKNQNATRTSTASMRMYQ